MACRYSVKIVALVPDAAVTAAAAAAIKEGGALFGVKVKITEPAGAGVTLGDGVVCRRRGA